MASMNFAFTGSYSNATGNMSNINLTSHEETTTHNVFDGIFRRYAMAAGAAPL